MRQRIGSMYSQTRWTNLLPPEVVPRQTFGGQNLLDHPLTCDSGMIRARQPERAVTLHTMPANHQILQATKSA